MGIGEPKNHHSMNAFSIAHFIKEFYPEYWGISRYTASKCAVIHRTNEQWGIFSNFHHAPITIDGVNFSCSEELFTLMKFRKKEPIIALYGLRGQGLKMKSKPWQKTHRRNDWGQWLVDAMKYCLMKKFEQNEEFRSTLDESRGLYIVERHANPRTNADAWSAKLEGDEWVGPNLLGRLLMELRDNGTLEYNLPDDAFEFIKILQKHTSTN